MTGGEIIAAGKAAEAVGKKVLGEDDKSRDVLLRVAENMPEMKAAARSMASRMAVKEQIKLKLYQPLGRLFGVSSAYFEETFSQDMAYKMADVPIGNIITPAPSVAMPVIQGLSYSFEEPSLKDLYLNLLATASDDRRSDQAHPAFADIIKQLSPRETMILNAILHKSTSAIARLKDRRGRLTRPSYITLMTHLLPLAADAGEILEEPQAPTWVDNWQRLGLVDVLYDEELARKHAYDWITN